MMAPDPLRRRSVGAPAARSVLLTILGEFMLPLRRPVWQETLVAALGAADISEQSARQALARSTRAGWLETERRGRRNLMTLSAGTAELLRRGAERIYAFGPAESWDGEWLMVVVRVPETQREVRHQLRTQLAWAGFGSIGGGVWITPRTDREREVVEIVRSEPAAEVVSFRGRIGEIGDAPRLVDSAWDLAAVEELYSAFVRDFARVRPRAPADVFGQQTLLVHAWRKFPFLDPGLPEDLLPSRWPRERAHRLFRARHAEWEATAREYFRALDGDVH